jgi:hypothetical protein
MNTALNLRQEVFQAGTQSSLQITYGRPTPGLKSAEKLKPMIC